MRPHRSVFQFMLNYANYVWILVSYENCVAIQPASHTQIPIHKYIQRGWYCEEATARIVAGGVGGHHKNGTVN